MQKTFVIVIFGIALSLILLIGIYSGWKKSVEKDDARLIKQAAIWIKQVDNYKKIYNKAPDSLEMIGIKVPDNYPLSYLMDKDSINYTISFQTGFFRSKYYNSINRYWQVTH